MRRMLALLLALVLLAASAAADSPEDSRYEDLRDKMYRQLVSSGLRGKLQLTVSGDSETAVLLSPLSGAILDIYTQSKGLNNVEMPYFSCYFSKNGVQGVAGTTLWWDGTDLYLKSDMLLDTVLRYPWLGDFYSSLVGRPGSNPSFLSAIAGALLHGRDWDPLSQPLQLETERFLSAYASAPETATAEGETRLTMRYVLPAQAVKEEMKELLRIALADEQLSKRIRAFYLTELQEGTAFSSLQEIYENQVIDTIPLEGDLVIVRTINTRGDLKRAEISLPLADNAGGWTELYCLSEDGTDAYTLQGQHPVALTVEETAEGLRGTFDRTGDDGQRLLADWSFTTRTVNRVDENQVEHEIITWSFRADPADEQYPFASVDLGGSFHFYTKRGDRRGDTTLEIDASGRLMGADLKLIGKMQTIAPRNDIPPIDVTGAQDGFALPAERVAELSRDFWVNMLLILQGTGETPAAPAGVPAPEASPAPAEDPEATAPAESPEPPQAEPGETEGTREDAADAAQEPEPEENMTLEEITEEIMLDEEGA